MRNQTIEHSVPLDSEAAAAGASRKKRKTSTTRVACNICRHRKSACDGLRPTCSRCHRRGWVCVYDTDGPEETRHEAMRREIQLLRERLAAYETIFPHLRQVPQTQLSNVLAQNKGERATNIDVQSILALAPIVSLSDHEVYRAVLPPTTSRLEYQLMTSHTTLYPCFGAPSQDFIPLQPLLRPASIGAFLSPKESPKSASTPTSSALPTPSHANGTPTNLCDPRLAQLDITFWTDVPITNEAAVQLLSLYLFSEQPIVGFLDAHLFVGDLVAQHSRFCSRFLVSCLFYWASHAFKTRDPDTPVEAFKQEAQKIWATQNIVYGTTTVVGALLLSIAASGDGLLELANQFMTHALDMSNALGWFGLPEPTRRGLDTAAAEDLKADSHAAWGLFNYITYVSMTSFYSQRQVMTSPPKLPIPGDGGVIGFDSEGSAIFHDLPDYMGGTFTAACKFFLIANEISLTYLTKSEDSARKSLSLELAESIYQRLLVRNIRKENAVTAYFCRISWRMAGVLALSKDWVDRSLYRLTGDATEDTDHQVLLHMWIHCRILDLFRPFLFNPPRLKTFAYRECTTKDIYTASLNQLKRHLIVFPLHHSSATHCAWFISPMLQTTSSVLSDPLDPDCRFWFGVCTRALFAMNAAFPLLSQMLLIFVGMAVQKGIVSPQEADAILRRLAKSARRNITADFVLDLNLALENRQDARMDRLASNLEEKLKLWGSGFDEDESS